MTETPNSFVFPQSMINQEPIIMMSHRQLVPRILIIVENNLELRFGNKNDCNCGFCLNKISTFCTYNWWFFFIQKSSWIEHLPPCHPSNVAFFPRLSSIRCQLPLKAEMKKVGSTESTLPEHSRFSPGTHKVRYYLKDVWIAFQAICFVKIPQFINISLLVPVA